MSRIQSTGETVTGDDDDIPSIHINHPSHALKQNSRIHFSVVDEPDEPVDYI